jgi:hypothetical protein
MAIRPCSNDYKRVLVLTEIPSELQESLKFPAAYPCLRTLFNDWKELRGNQRVQKVLLSWSNRRTFRKSGGKCQTLSPSNLLADLPMLRFSETDSCNVAIRSSKGKRISF